MTLLKCVLYALQILATVCGLNIYLFDAELHRFYRTPVLHLWMKLVHWILLIPTLIFSTLFVGLAWKYILDMIAANMEGTDTLVAIRYLAICTLIFTKYMQLSYVVFIYQWRRTQLQKFLNDFAIVYDQYVALFGRKLKVKWHVISIVFCKLIIIDVCTWVGFTFTQDATSFTKVIFIVLIYVVLALPVALVIACFVNLALLNAIIRGSTLSATHPLWRFRLHHVQVLKLVKFYEDLLHLCRDSDSHLRPFVAMQLTSEFVILVILVSIGPKDNFEIERYVHVLYAIFLIYPATLAHLCHEIHTGQKKMANELLTPQSEYIIDSSSKFVELFCLQKSVIAAVENRSWRVLHIQRGFVLQFVNLVFINIMYLHTIYVTSSLYRDNIK